MGHSPRARLALCALSGAALLALPGRASHPSEARCSAGALRAISSAGQGAAGTDFAPLRFVLKHPGRCFLRGYPGVTLMDGTHRLDIHVGRWSGPRVRTVHLDARHAAYFALVYRPFVPATGKPCPVRVTRLRLIPPDERAAVTVRLRPRSIRVCSHGLHEVMPVRASRSG